MQLPHSATSETPLNTWYTRYDSRGDFTTRLARHVIFPLNQPKVDVLDSMYARSTGMRTSIAVNAWSDRCSSSSYSTTATDATPYLTRGQSLVSSVGSADTQAASALDGVQPLEMQDDGNLTLPDRRQPDADLMCPFQILDCEAVFSDTRIFKTHIFSHFRGHPTPITASCFLCDNQYTQTDKDDPAWAWNNMLSHLVNDHYRQGQRLAVVRTDFDLMRWMFSRRIIDHAQFKRTQLSALPTVLPTSWESGPREVVDMPTAPMPPPAPVPRRIRAYVPGSVGLQSQPFTVQASRREERRRHNATRSIQGGS